MSRRLRTRSRTRGATIVNSYAPLTADGMMNRRNLRRFRCSAPDAMSTVASATPGHQFLLTTSQACVGSVAPAKNGTRDRASTSPNDAPYYWLEEHEKANEARLLRSAGSHSKTFLNEDFCAIEDHDFFVRGIIHLPIIGTAETLRWGVWGSLSRDNFQMLMKMNDDPKRVELPSMFSWLSTKIPEYPDTLSLKMYAHIQQVDWQPG